MSRKKSIIFIGIALVLGIAIGVGSTILFNNSGSNSSTGAIAESDQNYLVDEEGHMIEFDDAAQAGVSYRVCTFSRRGDEVETERHWYGPYATVGEALYEARRNITGTGFYEMHVYTINDDSTKLTFFGKTYYCKSSE